MCSRSTRRPVRLTAVSCIHSGQCGSNPPVSRDWHIRLFQPNGAICSLPVFNRAAAASGFLNVSRDADGVMRRVPVVMEYGGELYPSLALAAVQQIRGARLVTVRAAGDRVTLGVAGQSIPLDAHGRLLI